MAGIGSTLSAMNAMASVMLHPLDTASGVAGALAARGMAPDAVKLSPQAKETLGASLKAYAGGFACATTATAKATPQQLHAGLMSDWSQWWLPGKIRDFERTAAGGARFKFQPLSAMGVGFMDVGVELGAAKAMRTAQGHDVLRIPLKLSQDLKGHGYFEFRALPGGGSLVKSVWEDAKLGGLKAMVPGMSEVIGRAHLAVEDVYLKCLDDFARALKKTLL